MSTTRIIHTPRPDTRPETEAAVLAAVYRFLLDCRAKKKTAGVASTSSDDDMKLADKERRLA